MYFKSLTCFYQQELIWIFKIPLETHSLSNTYLFIIYSVCYYCMYFWTVLQDYYFSKSGNFSSAVKIWICFKMRNKLKANIYNLKIFISMKLFSVIYHVVIEYKLAIKIIILLNSRYCLDLTNFISIRNLLLVKLLSAL